MKQVRVDDYAYGIWFDVLGEAPGGVLIYDHLTKKRVALSTDGSVVYRNIYGDHDLLTQTYYNNLE